MGKYKDFADCIAKNKDKGDAKAYCGAIKDKAEADQRAKNEEYAKAHGYKLDEKGRIIVAENVEMHIRGEIHG
jgi:hypothetical protein